MNVVNINVKGGVEEQKVKCSGLRFRTGPRGVVGTASLGLGLNVSDLFIFAVLTEPWAFTLSYISIPFYFETRFCKVTKSLRLGLNLGLFCLSPPECRDCRSEPPPSAFQTFS